MTDHNHGVDRGERHLIMLRDELAGRRIRCALEDEGVWPRLRIYCPGEGASAEFDNNVVAAPIAGRWFFFWPWADPIGSVTRVSDAARRIIDDMCLDDDGAGQPVTSLAMWRMLQHARAGISSPRPPSFPPPGAKATRHQPPRQSRPMAPRLGTRPQDQTPGQQAPAGRIAAGEHAGDKASCRLPDFSAPELGGIGMAKGTPWRG